MMKLILSISITFFVWNSYGQCTATINSSNVLCIGECNGFIQAVGNGASPIDYSWSSGDNSAVITNVCAETYYLTMTDDTGCVYIDSVTITQPDSLEVIAELLSGTSGPGWIDGVLAANISGGTPSYVITWFYCLTNQVYPQWQNPYFPASDFYCVVMDNNGCIDSSECVTVPEGTSSIGKNTDFQFDVDFVNSTLKFNSEITSVSLFDVSGKLLLNKSNLNQNVIDFNLILNSGIYIVVAQSTNGVVLRKKLYLQE
jgi:hypothetical protein